MIRKWQSENTAPLLSLWLESTTEAHPFIDASYWQANEAVVRDEYLPAAETGSGKKTVPCAVLSASCVVPVRGGAVCRPGVHRKGDCALLNHVQQHYPYLTTRYQKNVRAVNFYHAQGFRIEDSAQDDTQHPTWIMSWQADQTP